MIQHLIKNVEGGNKLATVLAANGKSYVKVTMIPAGKAKELGVSQKTLINSVKFYHEQKLRKEAKSK